MQETEEPGGLQFMGLQRVRHDWENNQQQHGYILFQNSLGYTSETCNKNTER